MEKIIIVKEKIHSTDSRLKRHICHDSRSRSFAFNTKGLTLTNTVHARHIPILDQGNAGSCTGDAGIGALGTDPLFASFPKTIKYSLDQAGAYKLYSDAEILDGNGAYPPNDFGSSGLSIATVLKNAGIIDSYQHTFTMNDALLALTKYPILFGTNWYNSMFSSDPDGRVRIAGGIAGGHEIIARQLDVNNSRVWFDNSWGSSGWGIQGRFYLTFADFNTLLGQQGDVIVLIPKKSPTVTPAPIVSADTKLAAAMKEWMAAKGLN